MRCAQVSKVDRTVDWQFLLISSCDLSKCDQWRYKQLPGELQPMQCTQMVLAALTEALEMRWGPVRGAVPCPSGGAAWLGWGYGADRPVWSRWEGVVGWCAES